MATLWINVFSFVILFFGVKAEGSDCRFQMMQNRLDQMELLLKQLMMSYEQQETVISKQASTIEELQNTVRTMNKPTDDSQLSHVFKRQHAERVAFSTRLTTDQPNLSLHHPIVYNTVVTDLTNAYNIADGIFTVPVTGYYVFSWTTTVRYGQWLKSEIDINGKVYASLVVDCENDGDRGSGTQIVIVRANRGQHVFIRTASGGVDLKGENGDSFSGFLLFSEE